MKAFVVMLLVGCGWSGVEGSGKAKSDIRSHTGFNAVELAGAINAEITIAAEHRVEISGDDNLVPLVATQLDGASLEIRTTRNVKPRLPLLARVAAPRLTAVAVAGSSNVTINGMQGDELALSIGGSATIRGIGSVGTLGVSVSGSGKVELAQLAATDVTVAVTGGADVEISVSRSLAVEITGSGTVTYHGNPTNVTQSVTGSGRLVKR